MFFETHISNSANDLMTAKARGKILDNIYSAWTPERIEIKLDLFINGNNRWYNMPRGVIKIRWVWVICFPWISNPEQTNHTRLLLEHEQLRANRESIDRVFLSYSNTWISMEVNLDIDWLRIFNTTMSIEMRTMYYNCKVFKF